MAWPKAKARPGAAASFRLLGIPIQIDASWFMIVAFITWSLATGYFPYQLPGASPAVHWGMGFAAALALFACVLLHELGHSLVAQRHGIPVACVSLFLFGGVSQITGHPRRPSVELQVALAGPLVSGAIAWGCAAARTWVPGDGASELPAMLRYLAHVNLGLMLFNLLPGYPLDGGRVLRALIWAVTGNVRLATRWAGGMGALFGMALIAIGIWTMLQGRLMGGLWYGLLGMFLRNAASSSVRAAASGDRA